MSGSFTSFVYDQSQDNIIDSSNVAAATVTKTFPKIFRNNTHFIVRGNVYSDASTSTVTNLAALTLSAKIGTLGSAALISANNATFNLIADWSLASANVGAICFYCNVSGTAIDTALGSLEQKQYYCDINGTDTDSDTRTIAQFPILIKNIVE